LRFEGLSENRIREIYSKYGKQIFPSDFDVESSIKDKLDKNYCILIFLKDAKRIENPFNIDKKGFGNANAWLCVENIEKIKIK